MSSSASAGCGQDSKTEKTTREIKTIYTYENLEDKLFSMPEHFVSGEKGGAEQSIGIRKDIDRLEEKFDTKIDASIQQAKVDIIKWVIGAMMANTALVVAFLQFSGKGV